MCGIVAALSKDTEFDSKVIAEKMLSAITHRGPDERGYLSFQVDSGFTIGANRLSIIGRGSNNITPFYKNGRQFVLAYNGELYNYREIRKSLESEGIIFQTDTDTEVFYEAWAKWQEKALLIFNGMFAAVIYDLRSHDIYLARDISGQKPLHYYLTDRLFAVASEAKAFQELPIQLEITEITENEFYENFQHIHKTTLYKNVFQVLPATFVKYNHITNKVVEHEYWTPSFGAYSGTYDNATEELRDLITQSVKRHSNAEVKYGLYLSDGLDSNILNLVGRFENTYTYTSTKGSEKDIYRKLPEISRSLDFPIASLSSYPLFRLAEMASEDKCTVVLSGEGADELFGGYVRYLLPLAVDELWESKSNYRPLFSKAVPDPESIFSKITCRGDGEELVKELFLKIRGMTPDLLTAMQYFDFKYVMPSLLNMGDRMSSRFSLENRCPYLDKEVISFAFNLPPEYRCHNGAQKRILHDVGRQFGFFVKPQKTGLTIDFNNYLHRKDWDRASYFSILNYIWVSMFNDYKMRLVK